MEDISDCMMRVTRELRALQEHLRWIGFQSCDTSTQDRVVNDLLSLGLIQDLKSAVDHMRNFLWCYVDSAALNCKAPGNSPQLPGNNHLAQVTAMLRLLQGSTPAYLSFFEHMTRSVDNLMGRIDASQEATPQNGPICDKGQALGKTACDVGTAVPREGVNSGRER